MRIGSRRFVIRAVFAFAAPFLAAPASATPPGYFVDSTQANAERPADRVVDDGAFTLSIHRKYSNALEARLLDLAEATYPPRERLISVAIDRGFEMGGDSARASLWWCDGLGAARVPYCVTAGALAHYVRMTERFRAHNFWEAWAHNLFWTDLKYEAKIEHRDQYDFEEGTLTDVYVVQMTLAWGYDDGTFVPTCLAHRIVVLTPGGSVLGVAGDGQTIEKVMFSGHRGIGYVETQYR